MNKILALSVTIASFLAGTTAFAADRSCDGDAVLSMLENNENYEEVSRSHIVSANNIACSAEQTWNVQSTKIADNPQNDFHFLNQSDVEHTVLYQGDRYDETYTNDNEILTRIMYSSLLTRWISHVPW